MGLWIYSLKANTATKILRGPGASACWSPDGRHLAACLGPPFFAIWLADLKVGRATTESFDPVWTLPEHKSSLVEKFTREIETDPTLVYAYDRRAEGALWADDDKAVEYLRQFQRDRLLPLVLMLAHKAIEKEPENPDFQRILNEALCHAENREGHEVMW